MWGHIKDELYHYYLGSKLLWQEMRISTQLVKRVVAGHTLTRRERRQLLKTSADMFRLVRALPCVRACCACARCAAYAAVTAAVTGTMRV
jgi:LETM1 and EF-hand domain-containing protein 1